MLIITRNNLNAPSICQICLLLFGYKVNCSNTFLSFALKNLNKMPQNKKKTWVFIFLKLHGTSNEENEPSLCKTLGLIHVLFANDSMVKEDRYRLEPITYYYRQISVMVYSFFCFLFSCHSYCTRIVKIKAIFQAYKYVEEKLAEMTFALSLYRPPKPYMEVRYAVNVHT